MSSTTRGMADAPLIVGGDSVVAAAAALTGTEVARGEGVRGRGGTHGLYAATSLPALATAAILTAVGVSAGGFRPGVWRLATIALCLVAASALSLRRRVEIDRREATMLGALAAYLGWTFASMAWSIDSSNSVLAAERTLFYLAATAVVVIAVERSTAGAIVAGAVAATTLVAAVGLAQHYLTTRPLDPIEHRLLIEPLGYSNALGMFVGIGILLAVGSAVAAQRPLRRLVAAAPCLVLLPTLLLSSSRGACAAVAVGIVATFWFHRVIKSPALLVALVVVAVAVGVMAGTERHQSLSPLTGYRTHYWHVALDEYAAHPLLGGGAGTFGDYFWRYHRPSTGFTRVAHSLYLETLAELGPAGLVLMLVALATPLARLRNRPNPIVATAGGAYIAYLIHTGIDWDWQMPVLTVTGLLCGAIVLVGSRDQIAPLPPKARMAAFALAATAIVFAIARAFTGPALGP